MIIKKALCIAIFLLWTFHALSALPLAEQFKQDGYVEICNKEQGAATFDSLYAYFDEFIEFLQKNPAWAQKLYSAKERFIRSKECKYYSTDFFGFYDESTTVGRSQIAFYYSVHFHTYIDSYYPEFKHISQITCFLQACLHIQQSYGALVQEVATELGVEAVFSSDYEHVPILLKVIKYLPSYYVTMPHYDGTALSLFLDSTDNESLLLAPYKSALTIDDFSCPIRKFVRAYDQNTLLLIPGTLLTEFSIYPTPHIVVPSGKMRYATIAFAMRPHYIFEKNEFALLPNFSIE